MQALVLTNSLFVQRPTTSQWSDVLCIVLIICQFHLPTVKDRSKPFSDNIITAFFTEARRHWDEEEGSENLPKVQADMLLYLILGKLGRDKVGHFYLQEACKLGEHFSLHGPESPYGPGDARKPKSLSREQWMQAKGVTAWSLFNFQL